MEPQISVYAELRSYIRTISVAVSLPSPSDASTRLTIAADGVVVRVSHRGETRHLSLPAKTALGVTSIPAQKQGVTTVEWRLPLGADDASQASTAEDGTSLWSAMDLEVGSGVGCRNCGATIINPGSVSWKDLPSENWAEMMDFWHCHKPADHEHHDHTDAGKADEASLAARGYGASSTIAAQKGIGFVDLTTLLFSENDCHRLTVSLHNLSPSLSLRVLSSSAPYPGIKKVAGPTSGHQWRGYRYNCPISIMHVISCSAASGDERTSSRMVCSHSMDGGPPSFTGQFTS
jgi:hypothetical protein